MARNDALMRMHKTLVNRRTELRKRLGAELDDMRTDLTSGDSADVAFDSGSEELASQLAELEAKELAQIERALLKLKQGTYGVCEGCATRIPVIRLNALPYSTCCIKCQREMETNHNWEPLNAADWAKVRDNDSSMGEREVDLADIEIEIK